MNTDSTAPNTSMRWKPYVWFMVGLRSASHTANRPIRNDATSDSRCAALRVGGWGGGACLGGSDNSDDDDKSVPPPRTLS